MWDIVPGMWDIVPGMWDIVPGMRDIVVIEIFLTACLWFVCETIIIYGIPVLSNIIIERASDRFGDQVRYI